MSVIFIGHRFSAQASNPYNDRVSSIHTGGLRNAVYLMTAILQASLRLGMVVVTK